MFFPVPLSPPPRHTYFLYHLSLPTGAASLPSSVDFIHVEVYARQARAGHSKSWQALAAASAPPTANVCLTPHKPMMGYPPTLQRTPRWDEADDSLSLEGVGGGEGMQ